MKKFLAILLTVAMVLSIVTIPVIAEPKDTASKETEPSQPVAPQENTTLSEVLNVPGGNIIFTSRGEHLWVVDGDAAKSGNEGVASSTSTVATTVTAEEGDILRFDYMSLGEEGYDAAYDGLHLYIDGVEVMVWGIVKNLTTYSTPLTAGEHVIRWTYEKNYSYDNPGDYAAIDNVYVGSPAEAPDPIPPITLDKVLNVPGGNLTFTNDENCYPWVVDSDAAKSSNEGVGNSTSAVSTTVTTAEGDILRFEYQSHGEEGFDGLHLYVDGTEVMEWSIVEEWTTYSTPLTAGEHTIRWTYEKDSSVDKDGDYATIDNVYIGEPTHPESVEVQDITVPAGRIAGIQYTVLPDETYNKEVTFAIADENIAVIENGRVRGITEGTTTLTVTTVDGGISGTATVTVTEALPITTLLGYIVSDPNNDANDGCWGSFTDVLPSTITNLGSAADTSAEDTLAAASVGHMIYGFSCVYNDYNDKDYIFYCIDTDAGMTPVPLRTGAGRDVYAMAFDYTTNTMYAIGDFGGFRRALYTVNLTYGVLTEVGVFESSERMETLAIDEKGVCYAIGSSGNLYSVDLDTAELTLVGETGLDWVYQRSATYDMNKHQLFVAQYGYNNDGLYIVDTETAVATPLGHIGSLEGEGATVTGLLTLNDIEVPAPEHVSIFEAATVKNASVGQEVIIPVVLRDYEGNANSLEMQINYDTNALAVTGVDNGEFLTGAVGATVSVDYTSNPGSIIVGLDCLTAPIPAGDNNPITIVNVHFTVLEGGNDASNPVVLNINEFSSTSMDGTHTSIGFICVNGAIVAGTPTPAPTGTTPTTPTPAPTATPAPDSSLSEALNVPGGTLEFATEVEYPWVVYGDAAKSTNEGADSSYSTVFTTVTAVEGDILRFDFKSFGEEGGTKVYDGLRLYIDGNKVMEWGIVENWTSYSTALTAGDHTIRWTYDKDGGTNKPGDYAIVDNVYVGAPVHSSAVEVENVIVPVNRLTDIRYTVLPVEACNKDVTFSVADETIATIENGRIRGIAQGTTTITVTTVDGGISGTATVTVTEALPTVQLMGYIVSDHNNDANNGCWGSFTDDNPSMITNLGSAISTNVAASAGHMIYGYNCDDNDNRFYYIDTDAGMTPVYPGTDAGRDVFAMAFDYNTNTMYAIGDVDGTNRGLYIVDRYLGTLTEVGVFASSENMLTLAIDENGVGYAIGDKGSLYTVDLETAELTLVGETGLTMGNILSATYDMNTNQLFLVQNGYDNDGLYIVNTETAEVIACGHIGTVYAKGADVTCLLTLNDRDVPDPEIPQFTVTFVDGLDGTTISTRTVDALTVLDEGDFPTPPAHEGCMFGSWDYNGMPIYRDITITARYHNPNAPTATIIFEVDDVWLDGCGYQFLLDANANAYGSVFPSEGHLTDGLSAPTGVYDQFEYKIRGNADGNINTQNIVCGDSVTMEIPAGIYDWCITNPTPGYGIWIASDNGNISGRADNFKFEAGLVYHFHVYSYGMYDAVDLDVDQNEYTITYMLNDKVYTTQKYKSGEPVKAPEYTAPEGYTFSGWVGVPVTMPDHDVTVTATCTINEYEVTLINGVTTETIDVLNVEHGSDAVLPDPPENEGYIFEKWDGNPNCVTENRIITAMYWRIGDVNHDGRITTCDAVMIMRYAIGMETAGNELIPIMDFDGNGQVTSVDALFVMRIAIKEIETNGVGDAATNPHAAFVAGKTCFNQK